MKQLCSAIFFVFVIISCKQNKFSDSSLSQPYTNNSSVLNNNEDIQYADDTYCADVKYYNPNTGTHSTYRLTVEVESNQVISINFPNGGCLDTDHFNGAELDDEGAASFTSDKGYEYEIQIISNTANCFDGLPMAVRCKGKTQKGNQCRHLTDNENGLCWQHQNQE